MSSTSSSLTGTGSTSPVLMKEGIVRVSGTFSATVIVEVDALGDGTYAPAVDPSGASISIVAAGVFHINNGIACNTRLTCSAYTSGTINAALRAN
jgi:hypothetical protein